jgi:hypothetical protein
MKIADAEREIATILARLEHENDGYVEAIAVKDIEVTTLDSDRMQIARSVQISFKPKPGSNWAK